MFRGLSKIQVSGLLWALLGVFLFYLSLPMAKWALECFDSFFTAMARTVISVLLAVILLRIKKSSIFQK